MATSDPTAENGSVEQLDERDARALTEYMSVLADVGRARDAPGLFTVVGQNGGTYLVDTHPGACECPDHEYRAGDLGPHGCKHQRRVAFATGGRAIPAWVDRDEIDPALGEHVAGEVRFAAADGGEIIDAGDDGEILQEDTDVDEEDLERPDDCACGIWNEDTGLPCWNCFRIGFESRNPDPPEDGEDAGE